MKRREFAYSLAALALAPPNILLRAGGGQQGSAKGLTDDEKKTLGEICERIVPKDEYPGAKELGVVVFIDRLLQEAHPEWISVYRAGLHSIDQSSREIHGAGFAELKAEQQTALLERMERGDPPAAEFFRMVRTHTMEGCYSHPKWGGNRDKAAWKMISYDDFWA